jgi:hypothetical protein
MYRSRTRDKGLRTVASPWPWHVFIHCLPLAGQCRGAAEPGDDRRVQRVLHAGRARPRRRARARRHCPDAPRAQASGNERIYYAPGLVTLGELAAFVERFPRERAKVLGVDPRVPDTHPLPVSPTPAPPSIASRNEVGWPCSGGGFTGKNGNSPGFPLPDYQVNVPGEASSSFRNVPDVSMYAGSQAVYYNCAFFNPTNLAACNASEPPLLRHRAEHGALWEQAPRSCLAVRCPAAKEAGAVVVTTYQGVLVRGRAPD